MKRKPTISQLIDVVNAYNKAHELHLKYPPAVQAQENPLLKSLYFAAAIAAEQLKPVLEADIRK